MKSRAALEKAIRIKVQKDAAFRQKLNLNPHEAISDLTGEEISEDVTINIITEKPGEVNITVPAQMKSQKIKPDGKMKAEEIALN